MVADRSVLVRLRADISDFQRKFATAGATTSAFVKNLDSADSRMGNLVQTALALGPALVPITASATPALVGLTGQLGFAAAGAGVMISAFNGMGDAIGAVNDYQLEPTTENLQKMQEAMGMLPADAREFVRFLDQEVLPALDELQDLSAAGVLPGVADGLEDVMTRLPQIRGIVEGLADAGGRLFADAGEGLASDEFDDFFRFLKTEAEPTLLGFGRTVGNVFDGLATTLIGLNPLANDFEDALLEWSRGFADLDPSDFQGFVSYVRDVGPDAVDAVAALGGALGALVQAAAPVGAVALPAIEALANVIEAIAESPAGPVLIGTAAGLSAISRAVALYNAANGSAIASFLGGAGKDGEKAGIGFRGAAAGVGILALSLTDLDDNLGVSNTAMGAAIGLLIGPWGAAVGAGAGALMDLAAAGNDSADAMEALDRAVATGGINKIERELSGARDALTEAMNPDTVSDWAQVVVDGWKIVLNGMDDSSTEAGRLRDKINAAEEALIDLQNARGVNPLIARDLGMTTGALDAATSSANEFRQSLERVNRTLEGRANLRDYEAALDDFTEGLKENGRTLDITTDKGRANQENLDAIASTTLRVAENLKGTNRINFLATARENFIDAAMKLGRTKERAEALATQLGLLDKKKANPKIDADTKPARKKIDEAEDWIMAWGRKNAAAKADVDTRPGLAALGLITGQLNALDGRVVTTYVRTRHELVGSTAGTAANPTLNADGGFVPKTGLPYADRHHYLLADGEGVTTNRHGETDRFRDVVAGINRGLSRRQIKGMLADGRPRDGVFDTTGATNAEVLALMQASQRIRELVHELNKDGKDRLRGRQRDIAEQELRVAREDLREVRAGLGQAARDKQAERDQLTAERQREAFESMIEAANTQLDAAKALDDAAQAEVEATKARMAALGDASVSGFDVDLFGVTPGSSTPWAAGARGPGVIDPFAALATQEAGLLERESLQEQLAAAGLDGDALEAALSQAKGVEGNQALAALLESGRVQEFEDTWNRINGEGGLRDRVAGEAGTFAYGEQLVAQTAAADQTAAEVRELNATVARLEQHLQRIEAGAGARSQQQAEAIADGVGWAINGAAADGHRNRKHKRGRR